jgi:hypothetical protein
LALRRNGRKPTGGITDGAKRRSGEFTHENPAVLRFTEHAWLTKRQHD